MLGAQELLIILVIVLVVFGGAKLPKLARSIGEAQREFKRGTEEGERATEASDAQPPSGTNPGPGTN